MKTRHDTHQFTVRAGGYAPDTVAIVLEPEEAVALIAQAAAALADAASSNRLAFITLDGVLVKLKAKPAKSSRPPSTGGEGDYG